MLMNEINPVEQEVWDKKKIFLFALITALVLGLGFKTFVLEKNQDITQNKSEVRGIDVKGDQGSNFDSQTQELSPITKETIQKTFEEKVIEIRKDVEKINVVDVATSTPAIQKVINDIKNLQNYPQNQAKDACFKICEGL